MGVEANEQARRNAALIPTALSQPCSIAVHPTSALNVGVIRIFAITTEAGNVTVFALKDAVEGQNKLQSVRTAKLM